MLFCLQVNHDLCFERRRYLVVDFKLSDHDGYHAFPAEVLQYFKTLRILWRKLAHFFEYLIEMNFKSLFSCLNVRMILYDGWLSQIDVVKDLSQFF